MLNRIEKAIPELLEAHEKGDTEEVNGILATLKMPSSKEWHKGIKKLVHSSVKAGILRAHYELQKLKDYYNFAEEEDELETWEVISAGYGYEVVLPEKAIEFIRYYSYQLGVITEETVLRRLREELEKGLEEGLPPKEMTKRVQAVATTWMSEQHAQTIARTETSKFYNAGRLARWSDPDVDGFVEALQYDAIIDRRTTDFCKHVDGKTIAITNQAKINEYTPPNHFQCRATWLPVTRYEEWVDDFETPEQQDKGFTYENPTPFLLAGKSQPLVQAKKG